MSRFAAIPDLKQRRLYSFAKPSAYRPCRNLRAKSADLETEIKKNQLQALQESVARDVRNSWLDTQKAYERLTVTKQLEQQASQALELAEARYKLGLGSIVEYSQAELQKTDADLQDADAHYRYLMSQIELAYQMGLPR